MIQGREGGSVFTPRAKQYEHGTAGGKIHTVGQVQSIGSTMVGRSGAKGAAGVSAGSCHGSFTRSSRENSPSTSIPFGSLIFVTFMTQ